MKKNRPRKPAKQRKKEPKSPLKQSPSPLQASRLRRFAAYISNHPVILLVGVVVLFGTIFDWVVLAFYSPDIEVSGSDPASPFVFPFSVTNESWIFPMKDIDWRCSVEHMQAEGVTLDKVSIGMMDMHPSIGAGDIVNYSCPVMNPGVPVSSLTMDVSIKYTFLGIWRRVQTQPFIWIVDNQQSKWIKGTN